MVIDRSPGRSDLYANRNNLSYASSFKRWSTPVAKTILKECCPQNLYFRNPEETDSLRPSKGLLPLEYAFRLYQSPDIGSETTNLGYLQYHIQYPR